MKGKKLTQTQAIRKHCADCIYDPNGLGNGTMLEQIEACTAPDCALYEWRPLSSKTKNRLKQEKYDAMTDEEKAKYDAKAEVARKRLQESMGR